MNAQPPIVPPQSHSQPPRPKGWWSRNWKWFVPTLSVAGLALVIGVIYLIITMALSAVTGMMKSSGAYKQAMTQVRADPAVTAALGTPLQQKGFISGNISTTNASGRANLSIPISGPKGSGTVYVNATMSAGQWTFDTLTVQIDATGKRIDVLQNTVPDAALDMSKPGGVMFPRKRTSPWRSPSTAFVACRCGCIACGGR